MAQQSDKLNPQEKELTKMVLDAELTRIKSVTALAEHKTAVAYYRERVAKLLRKLGDRWAS